MLKPKLRGIEALPTEIDGSVVVVLRDPKRYVDNTLVISQAAALLVLMMDGERSLDEIHGEWSRATGNELPRQQLDDLVTKLDNAAFLENTRFEAVRDEKLQAFKELEVRQATHAGSAYAAVPDQLNQQFETWFEEAKLSPATPNQASGRLRALFTPHIDFYRGGVTYARAYAHFLEHAAADRYIVFGVSHQPMTQPFALTRKHFVTPLGQLDTDTKLVDQIASKTKTDFFADEWNHHAEHSLEFQAVCLSKCLGTDRPAQVIPILCSPPAETLEKGGPSLGQVDTYREFIDALKETLDEAGGSSVFIGAVDLSHVGLQFGDPAITLQRKDEVATDDQALIERMLQHDKEGFMQLIQSQSNQNNVCGVAPIYTVLDLLPEHQTNQLDYQQWQGNKSIVSYTAISYLDRP